MDTKASSLLPTRYSLLSRLRDWQDDQSWQEFFDTYWRLIYSVALKAGLSETEAQEAVQETLISVAKNIYKFKRDPQLGSFKGWLRNIARWRISDQLRKRTKRGDDETPLAEELNEWPPSAREDDWDSEWKEHVLKMAIERVKARVKPEHFQIFDLYALRQWPMEKVAQTLRVSPPRVYLAKHRVAALIKKEIAALEKGGRWGMEQ